MIGARYHALMAYRREGLRKYGGRFTSDIYGPPARLSFPTVHVAAPPMPHVRVGPFFVADNPPILRVVRRLVAREEGPLRILEIGPGTGALAAALRAEFGNKIGAYYGIEADENVEGPYDRIADVGALRGCADLVIASEVIEHMPAQQFFDGILAPLMAKLERNAILVVGTPNALSPSSIFGDFTHVQAYPWYDLYALLRLFFEEVDVVRTRYVWSVRRAASLLARAVVARTLELDWCEGIICIAKQPCDRAAQEAAERLAKPTGV
jgi:2-polyprenyl-3-methyl-5-hydroxy-6-metoxy-1,4-benzoquinol methylase